MKKFTRIEPTTVHAYGDKFKRIATVKNFQTEDGQVHEFTTFGPEGSHDGAVIALTPDKKVVCTYQFRAGPEEWLCEIPGGSFNEGEDFQAAALRELREETGYLPGKVEYLGDSMRNAYSNTVWHYYLATDCVLAPEGRLPDEHEIEQGTEVRLISIDELIDNARGNRMSDPHAVLMAYERLIDLKKEEEK